MGRALLIVLAAAALVPAASASEQRGFAFGRIGGNIRAYSVSITNDGVVRTHGAVEVGRMKLTLVQVAELNRIASVTRFTALPLKTSCKGTLPDVAATFIRVGPRTVHVHGSCVARYSRLWKALTHTVKVSFV
jgi:hypothetical protein